MTDLVWLAVLGIVVLTVLGGTVFFLYDSILTLLKGEA